MVTHRRSRFSKKTLYYVLESSKSGRKQDRRITIFLVSLILINVFAVMFETVASIYEEFRELFLIVEYFSVVVFSIEYLARLWISSEETEGHPLYSRLKFIFSPMGLIDLISIAPFYLVVFFPGIDLRFVRAMRLFRMVRVLKLGRYSHSMKIMGSVFKSRSADLLVTLSVASILLCISASAMYFFENEVQPKAFASIPAAMWWAVATLTTVGYGDVYPITVGGKIFGSLVAILGVGLIAIPTGILGAGLVESIDKSRKKKRCPHCEGEL